MKSIRAYSFWRFWPLSLPIQFHALLFVLIAIFHKNTPNTGCPALGVHIIFGVACLIVALLIETKLEGILWGFAGAGIFPGIMMICKYFYWSSPKNKERYEERLENERIEQHDELKTKIRDRAGRYTYSLGLLVVCFSILVFGILGALEVIDNARMIVLYLSGYLLFQVIAGIVIFNKLMKKY